MFVLAPDDVVDQRRQHVDGVVAAVPGDEHGELGGEVGIADQVALRSLTRGGDVGLQRGKRGRVAQRGQQACGGWLDDGAGQPHILQGGAFVLQKHAHLAGRRAQVDGDDARATMFAARDGNQAFGFQQPQRLAHGRSRDGEFGLQHVLRMQFVARFKAASDDLAAQFIGHHFGGFGSSLRGRFGPCPKRRCDARHGVFWFDVSGKIESKNSTGTWVQTLGRGPKTS